MDASLSYLQRPANYSASKKEFANLSNKKMYYVFSKILNYYENTFSVTNGSGNSLVLRKCIFQWTPYYFIKPHLYYN